MKNHIIRTSGTRLCLLLLLSFLFLSGCSAPGPRTDGLLPDSESLSPNEEAPDTGTGAPSPSEEDVPATAPADPPDAPAPADAPVPPETAETEERPEDTPSASPEILALLDGIVSPSMSEYEKVKAIHDYLVIHVVLYPVSNNSLRL